jgi:hypothetical protein
MLVVESIMITEDSHPYRRRRILAVVGQRQVSRPRGWWVLIKQPGHESVDLFLRQSYMTSKECQIGVVISPAFTRQGG